MKLKHYAWVAAVIVSVLIHALLLTSQFSITAEETVKKKAEFIEMVDVVLVEQPVIPEQPEPEPVIEPEPEIQAQVNEAVIPVETPVPEEPVPVQDPPPVNGPETAAGGKPAVEYLPFYRVDSRPEFLSKAELDYPLQAERERIEGTVILEADIDELGTVHEIRVLKTAGFGFDEAASKMIRESTFNPAYAGGQPVAVRMRFTVKFEI